MTDYHKFEPIENVEYIYCEHLQLEWQKAEMFRMYIGEGKRVILCPLCYKQILGHMLWYVSKINTDTLGEFLREESDHWVRGS